MQPTNFIGSLLEHVSAQLNKQSDQVLQEQLGIGFSQFKILRTLQRYPNMRQRDIAGQLGQTEASISRQVKLMVEQHLLSVTVSPKNRREHRTDLTPKGVRLTEAAVEVLGKYHAPTFAALNDKQRSQLGDALVALHQRICTDGHDSATSDNA